MNKKDIFTMESIAYYSGLKGIEIKKIEYGINDYVLATSGAWGGKKKAHRVKIYVTKKDEPYFMIHGYKILLNECIRL